MKKMRWIMVLTVFALVLAACGGAAPAAPAESGGQKATEVATPPPPPAPDQAQAGSAANVPDPKQAVNKVMQDYLTAMQGDLGGQAAQGLLTKSMQDKVTAGASMASLLGVQNAYSSFELSDITFSPEGKQAIVEATLNYAESPARRRFVLVSTEDVWKIQMIEAVDAQSQAQYPDKPEDVVQQFLAAYQQAPDQMKRYVSAEMLTKISEGGMADVLQLNGPVEGYIIQSASVSNDPPQAAVTVNLRAGGVDSTRIFFLAAPNGQWQIDALQTPQ